MESPEQQGGPEGHYCQLEGMMDFTMEPSMDNDEYALELFGETEANEVMAVKNRKMTASEFVNCDLTGSRLYKVHLKQSLFDGINLPTEHSIT